MGKKIQLDSIEQVRAEIRYLEWLKSKEGALSTSDESRLRFLRERLRTYLERLEDLKKK